jgi:hypothetical protein
MSIDCPTCGATFPTEAELSEHTVQISKHLQNARGSAFVGLRNQAMQSADPEKTVREAIWGPDAQRPKQSGLY